MLLGLMIPATTMHCLVTFAGPDRRYVMLGGKGGVGKTSSAASLAVKFAAAGHSTLVVSTDPAHSLSDALDQVLPPARVAFSPTLWFALYANGSQPAWQQGCNVRTRADVIMQVMV
jgi:thymidylate kinase